MFNLTKPFYPILLGATKGDPELAHRQLLKTLSWLERDRLVGKNILRQLERSFCLRDPRLQQTLWGLQFNNPLGLAAGCDKDAVAAGVWSNFGFGFAEVGGVTFHAQPGNPLPRLFRLSLDKAVLNRMGGNNLGASAMADTLKETWQRQERNMPIGINLIKSKIASLDAAAEDYASSFCLLRDLADYFVVNVSSPNTPGLRSLQEGEQLESILMALEQENPQAKPIFIKIAPDLSWQEIASILELSINYKLAGIIATNTTIRKDNLQTKTLSNTQTLLVEEAGGISGAPLTARSTEVIRFIWQQTQGKVPIIGVGGIFNANDAWEKIIAGASLLQMYTGWIYEGPWVVPNILRGLLENLENLGLSNIQEAIGIGTDRPI
jgi:dihydroorotate dehydrogenase